MSELAKFLKKNKIDCTDTEIIDAINAENPEYIDPDLGDQFYIHNNKIWGNFYPVDIETEPYTGNIAYQTFIITDINRIPCNIEI